MATRQDAVTGLFAQRMETVQKSFIREILKVTERPEVISFAGGLPNPSFFPVQPLAEACAQVLAETGPAALASVNVATKRARVDRSADLVLDGGYHAYAPSRSYKWHSLKRATTCFICAQTLEPVDGHVLKCEDVVKNQNTRTGMRWPTA